MEFKVGDKYYILNVGPGNKTMPYKIHIVAIVEGMIVYKWYGKCKQYWHYIIEHPAFLEIKIIRNKDHEEFKEKRNE